MCCGKILTTEIFEWLLIGNVNDTYQSTNRINYIRQMLGCNYQCTSLDCVEETLLYLAPQYWYDIDSAKHLNPLSATAIY